MNDKNIVLITGASSGIGRQTTLFLASRGYTVYASSRTPLKLDNIKNKNIIPIKLDITNQENINQVIETIYKEENKLDILINNAGYGLVSTVEDMDEIQMKNQFDINVFGVLRVCKAVIPIMRTQKSGIIINISSFLGKIGLPLLTFYNSSKYAVEGITDSLRYELKDFGIRVHSIMPGFFDTNFARDNLVVNEDIFHEDNPYNKLVSTLAPVLIEQINNGNNALEVSNIILEIINDKNHKARVTAVDKAKKFIPMKKELSDEDFERRVREYYNLGL
jgi:short-subunit dehydrogenase